MKTLILAGAVVVGLLLPGLPVSAHHSFSAEFDIDEPVTLQGTLTRMAWTNPHGWLYVDVQDDQGEVVNWAVELGAPNALLRRGLRAADFPAGLEVVVEGYRAKDGTPTANGITISMPDGRNFFTGSSGTGAPSAAGANRPPPTRGGNR